MEEKSRSLYLDNIKGILIILVVFGHFLCSVQSYELVNTIVDIIYIFHMPAFIFIAGYLSKSEHSRSKESLFKLFLYYIIFNTIMMFFSYAAYGIEFNLLTPYYSCWYILALIVWRMVVDKFDNKKSCLFFIIFFSLAVGFFKDATNVLAISRIICFFPFFFFGYYFPNRVIEKLSVNKKKIYYFWGFLVLACAIFMSIYFLQTFNVSNTVLTITMDAYTKTIDVFFRTIIFLLAILWIAGILLTVSNRKIYLITKAGKNSLAVYLLHRFITLLCEPWLLTFSAEKVILISSILTLITVFLLSRDIVTKYLRINISMPEKLSFKNIYACVLAGCICVLLVSSQILSSFPNGNYIANGNKINVINEYKIYNTIDYDTKEKLSNDIKILFCGDLILLEDQVKRGNYDGKYNFNELFEFTKEYISSADYAIGVLEGPVAGEELGYSTSNYDDNKKLALNYPIEFAEAIKETGFDLVSTANNHLLDKDITGAINTLDALDNIGLEHIGSYRNKEEKNNLKIVELNGLKIAILAYTFGSNYYTEEELLSEELSYITSITVSKKSKNFEKVKQTVKLDFEKAKSVNPDLIMVIPHMGTQFTYFKDEYQSTWNEIFLEFGADIILDDHAHSVQPIEFIKDSKSNKAIINCPGNYTNIYNEYFGDASALTEIYINTQNKNIDAISVIPMWTESQIDGNYRPLPIYDVMNNKELQKQISINNISRIEEVNTYITCVMLSEYIPMYAISKRYYVNENGVLLEPAQNIALSEKAENSILYSEIINSGTVCFIGDSITEGTKNGGFGWYEPIINGKFEVIERAKGGGTTKTILGNINDICDLYIIALGTNDIRYRDSKICAMDEEEYIHIYTEFVEKIKKVNPKAKFAFVAPWMSLENDENSKLNDEEKNKMLEKYSNALEKYCTENKYIYSNPNSYIRNILTKEVVSKYLVDYIHPNGNLGIGMYSLAVLENSK